MVGKLERLDNSITKIRNASNAEDLLSSLQEASNIGYESDGITAVEHAEPETAEIYDKLAEAYDQAIEKIQVNQNLAELNTVAKSFKNIVSFWRTQAFKQKERRVSEYIDKAKELYSRGDYKSSISLFEEALKLSLSDSMTSEILTDQGTAYYNNGQIEEAIRTYEEAIRLCEINSRAWTNKGAVLYSSGRERDSVMYFEKAIELDPNNADTLTAIGRVKYTMKDYRSAKIHLEKAIAINSTLPEAWNILGAVYNDGFGEVIKSRDCFKRALALSPDSLIVKANLAESLIILKEFSGVEHLLSEVINSAAEPVYGFVSRLLLIVYYFLRPSSEQRSFVPEVLDFLSYYESLPLSADLSWCFSSLRKTIESSDIAFDQKELLNSLLTFNKKQTEQERETAVSSMRKELVSQASRTKIYFRAAAENLVGKITGKKSLQDIRIGDVIKPNKDEKGQDTWEVFLDASDDVLSKVEKVKYTFDATFTKREVIVTKKEGGFRLTGQGWGGFSIRIKVYMKDGEKVIKYHSLNLAGATTKA